MAKASGTGCEDESVRQRPSWPDWKQKKEAKPANMTPNKNLPIAGKGGNGVRGLCT